MENKSLRLTSSSLRMEARILCLICQRDCAGVDIHSSSFQPSPPVSKEIHVYFVLKHVLELPSEQLENYLRQCPNPREWIRICVECNENFIKKCSQVFVELVEARRRFTAARMRVIKKIKSSCQEDETTEEKGNKQRGEKFIFNVTKETRRFVSQWCKIVKNKFKYENVSSSNNDSFLAGDLMAREMLTTERSESTTEIKNERKEFNVETVVKNEHILYSDDNYSNNDDDILLKAETDLSERITVTEDNEISSDDERETVSGITLHTQYKEDKRKLFSSSRRRKKIKRPNKILSKSLNHYGNKESADLQIIQCGTCHDNFSSQKALSEHMLKVHKTFHCELCGKDFLYAKTLKRHVVYKHEVKEAKFSCTFHGCGKSFLQKWLLEYHEKFHYPPQFKCQVCNKTFHIKAVLKRHMTNHETLGEARMKSLLCELCPTRCSSETLLAAHTKSKHGNSVTNEKDEGNGADDQESFRCSFCGKFKSSQECLSSHIRVVHERKYETCCDLCGKIFVKHNSLKRHKRMVHDIGDLNDDRVVKIKCTMAVCDRKFGTEALLKQHLSLHEKRPEFQCEHCGLKVFSARNLRSHVGAVHTNRVTKPFKCSVCGKGFAHKNYLWSHMTKMHQQ